MFEMRETTNGKWVLAKEHEQIVKQLEKEVERLKKELKESLILIKACANDAAELERLKKELEDKNSPTLKYWYERGKEYGLSEGERRAEERMYSQETLERRKMAGERRAMQRVKETLLNARKGIADSRKHENREFYSGALSYVEAIEEELGLSDKDDEVQP